LTACIPCHANARHVADKGAWQPARPGAQAKKDAPAKGATDVRLMVAAPSSQLPFSSFQLRAGVVGADVLRQYAEAALIFSYFSGSLRAATPTEKVGGSLSTPRKSHDAIFAYYCYFSTSSQKLNGHLTEM